MTLLDRMLQRGFEMPVDPVIAARLERHVNRIKPDPLFQRRLRGQVLNRYVATREGMVAATRPAALPRRNLGVLGRGVLYASLLTAVSATAVGAAAQESLPGDVLYGVKLEIESIRMEIAPADLRDDLAAVALDTRLDEVEALASAGRWEQVDAAVTAVVRAEETLVALTAPSDGSTASEVAMPEHVDRLTELLATAPDAGRRGLLRALAASGGSPSAVHSNRDHESQNRGQRKGQQIVPPAPSGSPQPATTATSTPSPSSTPTATPSDQAEPDPSPTPRQHGGGHGGGQGGGQGGGHGGGGGDGDGGNKDPKPPKDAPKGNGAGN
ncbi:MAG TPA: DUF5667 domain-containing protein [Candidatus Limnocylindria bacterium]|jgi:hypothetical protein